MAETGRATAAPQVPEEELRLALVLNGGVSLAVWMGGVSQEIQRLTDPDASDYGPILALSRTHAVADVISGTSAGGINGAALALAQVNTRAELRLLRDLWSDQGRMEELLRQPFQGQPTSLLRGDEYFLPELRRAMRSLAVPFQRRTGPDGVPTSVDLTITTTLLSGSQQVTVDDLGQDLTQRLHDATFNFVFDETVRSEQDDAADVLRKARGMALAARATASFPFAFEPVFVPVDSGAESSPDDMSEFASWAGRAGEDTSRYAVDGGVLANTPTRAALEAIDRRGAAGPVRRTMMLVFPHAPASEDVPADRRDRAPSTVGGLSAVLGALQSQGSRTYVERIEEHNRVAADWRGGRLHVLTTVGADIDSLFKLAEVAWHHYADLRMRKAALDLTERVPFFVSEARRPFEYIRQQAEAAQHEITPSPYIAAGPPVPEGVMEPGWQWGYTTALGVADGVAEILRAALGLATTEDAEELSARLAEVTAQRLRILDARQHTDGIWEDDPYLHGLDPDRSYWVARLRAYRGDLLGMQPEDETSLRTYFAGRTPPPPPETLAALLDRHGEQGAITREAVLAIAGALVDALGTVQALAATPRGAESSVLRAWGPLLALPKGGREQTVRRLTQRLLALDVAVWLVADGPATGTSLPIKLVQLSLQTQHPWVVRSTTPDDKAAGMGLARFGGFLKRSWRMNDWFWGRLDAVAVLSRTVLDPERLRQVGTLLGGIPQGEADLAAVQAIADDEFEKLRAALLGGEPEPPEMAILSDQARDDLRAAFLGDTSRSQLTALAAYAAYPLQARIALEELPVVVSAIRQDRVEGASRRSRGEQFLEARNTLVGDVERHVAGTTGWLALGAQALAAFDAAGVGREPLADEAGSDVMVRTSTKAAGVFATLLDSPRFGMKAIRPVTRTIRGASLLPYWIVNGLAGGAPLPRFLATLGLVGGGVLLALGLFGVLGWAGPVSGTVGAAILVAALGYSALRTGSLLHGVALLGPVLPLVAYALDNDTGGESGEAAGGLMALLVLVAGLYLLGRMPWPLRSPRALVHTPEFRQGVAQALVGLAVLAALVGLWVGGAWAWGEWGNVWIAVAASLVALAVGGLLADRCSKGLRRWRPGADSTDLPGTPGDGILGPFDWEPVDDADGVAAAWSGVYGAVYLAAAWILGLVAEPHGGLDPRTWNWVSAALAAWSLLAVILLLVAPLLLSRRSWVRSARLLAAAGAAPDDPAPALLRRLIQVDAASWHYCEPATGSATEKHEPIPELRLTRAGHRLHKSLPPRDAGLAPLGSPQRWARADS